ncbi:hypothetical protein [Tranquillimonas alkanivorans]|uniref:Uncharacterized protein n=1 Tax=Tranquillimonas alkanivorans TaxID=441119 RepID=A0A1I5WCD7_9RHOB|nr:hypothetical protein [Tranquillimonas alkanivorans]SFQ16996.1 hypothetical protein SAMN04488047_1432 [Tranquillimonas alkanivorans]
MLPIDTLTLNVQHDDCNVERPRAAGRLVFCNYPALAHENDAFPQAIRKDAILVPVYKYEHSSYGVRAAQADAFNEDGPARINALQMIAEGLGRRPSFSVEDPQAVLDAARPHNPFYCPWDSGLAGFFVFGRADLRKYGSMDALLEIANEELSFIEADLNGEWYCIELVDEEGDVVQASSGYRSADEAMEAGPELLQFYLDISRSPVTQAA